MDAADLREAVETDRASELNRLGSSQLLVALTGGSLERAAVLDVAAASERAARETFRAWLDEPDPDLRAEASETVREAFEAVVEQEDRHLERVRAAADGDLGLDSGADGDGPGPMHAYLRGRTNAVERVAGGMVGRPLVSLRTHTQVISFFLNEADERRADVFRELRDDTEGTLTDGLALLDALCVDEADWERAESVASYTVRVAYDDYADALRDLGLDPKVLC